MVAKLFCKTDIKQIANTANIELLKNFTDDDNESNGKILNEKLRNNLELDESTDKNVKKEVLSAINNCSIKKVTTLYRGLKLSIQGLKDIGFLKDNGDINLNKEINLNYFNSMSLDYNVSLKYALTELSKSVILEVKVPKNTNCFPIMLFSKQPEDKEIVFWNINLIIDSLVQDDNVDYHFKAHLI